MTIVVVVCITPKAFANNAIVSQIRKRMIRAHTIGDWVRSFGAERNQGRKGADNREGTKGDRTEAGRTSRPPTDAEDVEPRPALKPGAIYDGKAPPQG